MHTRLALVACIVSSSPAAASLAPKGARVAERQVQPRQTSNPGGPVQSLSSATDVGTTGVLSIQTDTSVTLSIPTDTETTSSAASTSGSSETSAAVSSSVSPAGAALPRETGLALAAVAAAAAGFAGAVVAL
ncbi:hypothetical protein GGR54DRAFT_636418 [Hypoxylon sp. NC1633]|nr:hypothetical protein GGR54DRAFT_636418 [Hypoxylon sp. NC1633]